MAIQRGKRCRIIQEKKGHSSAVTRMATIMGMTSSFNWMISQMSTPIAAAMSRKRHAYSAVRRSPRGTCSLSSPETMRVRSRSAEKNEPRDVSSGPLITPV